MTKLIGEVRMANYCEQLSKMLLDTAALSDLDTAKTEELMDWVSMEMENHSQNISRLRRKLMTGLKDFDWIMSDPRLRDKFLVVFMVVQPNVRTASIQNRPGEPTKVTAHIKR